MTPSTTSTPARRRGLFWFLGITAALAVFFIVLVVNILKAASQVLIPVQSAQSVGDKFLTALEKSDYTGAYGLLTPDAQAANPVTNLTNLEQTLQKDHGAALGHSGPAGFQIGNYKGQQVVRLGYQERFTNGSVQAWLVVEKTPAGWQVLQFQFPVRLS